MTATMRAVVQRTLGGPEVLALEEVPRPTPGPGEVLVRVHAAGVNPADWKTRESGGLLGKQPPFTVGWDVSGTVEELGLGVARFEPGDAVYGFPRFPHEAAAYAEYVVAPARHFAPKPSRLDHVQAAALPLAGLTAWQASVDVAAVRSGQRVLVHAAAGGVGHLAVQIAKARGAYVIGTASAPKLELLRRLGVDEPLDYTAVDFAASVRNVDVVLDCVGGDLQERSLPTLRKGGTLVSIVPPLEETVLAEARRLGVRAAFMLVEPDHVGLERLTELVQDGKLKPLIDQTLPLAEAAKAHELSAAGRLTGKAVLSVA